MCGQGKGILPSNLGFPKHQESLVRKEIAALGSQVDIHIEYTFIKKYSEVFITKYKREVQYSRH